MRHKMAGSGFFCVVVESMRMRILKGNWRKLQSCFQLWLSRVVRHEFYGSRRISLVT